MQADVIAQGHSYSSTWARPDSVEKEKRAEPTTHFPVRGAAILCCEGSAYLSVSRINFYPLRPPPR